VRIIHDFFSSVTQHNLIKIETKILSTFHLTIIWCWYIGLLITLNNMHRSSYRKNRWRGCTIGTGHRHIQKTEKRKDRVHGPTTGRFGKIVFGLPVSGYSSPGDPRSKIRTSGTSSPSNKATHIHVHTHM